MIRNLLLILKRVGGYILVITWLSTLAEQILTSRIENELGSMDGASIWIWLYGIASMLISTIEPCVVLVLCLACLRSDFKWQKSLSYFLQLVKESCRAMGHSIWWGLLLVVPGIIRFLQFSFIPFVIFFDAEYSLGKKDALKESTKLVNKRFIPVLLIVLLFTVGLPFILSSLDEWSLILKHPFTALGLVLVDGFMTVLSILLLLRQWEKSHGAHVQLAAN
jgi:hypothetical protein